MSVFQAPSLLPLPCSYRSLAPIDITSSGPISMFWRRCLLRGHSWTFHHPSTSFPLSPLHSPSLSSTSLTCTRFIFALLLYLSLPSSSSLLDTLHISFTIAAAILTPLSGKTLKGLYKYMVWAVTIALGALIGGTLVAQISAVAHWGALFRIAHVAFEIWAIGAWGGIVGVTIAQIAMKFLQEDTKWVVLIGMLGGAIGVIQTLGKRRTLARKKAGLKGGREIDLLDELWCNRTEE